MADHSAAPPPLALSEAEIVRLGEAVVHRIAAHMAGQRDRRVHEPVPLAERRMLLQQPFPEEGMAPDAIIDLLATHVMPWPMGSGHPRFYAWVNSPPAPVGVLADAIAGTMNSAGDGAEHAGRFLLASVTRWLMELVGFPQDGSHGQLVGGGSMANLTGLAVARHWATNRDNGDVRAEGLQGGRAPLVIYGSGEAHSCVRKSIELLGLGTDHYRAIPTDADFRMRVDALAEAVAADRRKGLRPFCVVGSAGTVNTGAIDPLDEMADLAARENLWLHVDGAYGAVGRADPAVAPLFAGMERAQSLALDPHKWLSVPIECGCVLVRDGELQREAFTLVPPYLDQAGAEDPDNPRWTMEYGFTLTSQVRALKTFATLAHMGRAGVARMVASHNRLARRLAAHVEAAPDLVLAAPVTLSICCFRYVPVGWAADDPRLDALTRKVIEGVNATGEAFLTPTALNGRTVLRACIMHYDNDEADMDHLAALVRSVGQRVAAA